MPDTESLNCACPVCDFNICGKSDTITSEEPCLQETENKVFAEVQWGEDIRLNKEQARRFETVEKYQDGPKRLKQKKKKKKPEIICICGRQLPAVVEKPRVINRDCLTPKEHINLLAQPRHHPIQKDPFHLVCYPKSSRKKYPKDRINPPRHVALAIPATKRLINTWTDYEKRLTPEQLTFLKKLLQQRDALTTYEANRYFKLLSAKRKKQLRKKQEAKARVICQMRQKSKKDIDRVVDAVMKFFLRIPYSQIKDRHSLITHEMLNRLIDPSLAKLLKRTNKDVYSQELFMTLDQMAVWVDMKIDEIDTVDLEGEEPFGTISISTSGTDTAGTESWLQYSDQGLKEESQMRYDDWLKALWEAKLEADRLAALAAEAVEEEEEEEMEEEGEWGRVRGLGEGEEEEEEGMLGEGWGFGEGEEEEEEEGLLEEEEGEMEEEEFEGEEGIGGSVRGSARGSGMGSEEEEEGEGMAGGARSEGEVEEEEEESVKAEEVEIVVEEEEEEEEGEEEKVKTAEELSGEGIRVKPAEFVKEHSPDMVCCVTLKLWASWLMEVAHNTHNWCKWITEVIGQIRFYAAILRGEVKNEDGTTRTLFKEEWENFKQQLDKDILCFRTYNLHVQELSNSIIEQFHGKEVACCPLCLQSRLILSVDQGHEVLDQLVEAIRTSEYWRKWLDNLVDQAKKISELSMQTLPPAPGDLSTESMISAPSVDMSIYELLESRTEGSSASGSYWLIEEFDPDPKTGRRRQP